MENRFVIRIPKSVEKSIAKIPLPWRARLAKAIDALAVDPWYGEKMVGKLKEKRKIRVWPYRVLYTVLERKRIILILEVGHRGSISYK